MPDLTKAKHTAHKKRNPTDQGECASLSTESRLWKGRTVEGHTYANDYVDDF